MERHRKQLASSLILASTLITAVATFLLPPLLQAQTQPRPNVIDPTLLARANAGDARSQASVGLAYAMGKGVPRDYAQAASWYRKAAEQGDHAAAKRLGITSYAEIMRGPKFSELVETTAEFYKSQGEEKLNRFRGMSNLMLQRFDNRIAATLTTMELES